MTKKNQQIALVTGGTRGIGASISTALKDAGYTVIANYRNSDERAKKFKASTGIDIIKFDVSDFKAVQKSVDSLITKYGQLDVLVNNAGITKDGFLHKMSEEDWDHVININLKSAFNLCRAALTNMRANMYGRIINISSINAQKGQIGQVNYCASKAGLIGFTKALALENATKKITVNTICPGYIDTEMTAQIPDTILPEIIKNIPAGRMGTAQEIAASVVYLASEQAAFITGSTLSINGGHHLS